MSSPTSLEMDMWSDALRLRGRLGALEVGRLRRAMQRLSLSGMSEIVLDLREVEHADYRALKPLFASVCECERRGTRVRASYGSQFVQDLFRLAYPGRGETLLEATPPPAETRAVNAGAVRVHANG